MTHSAVELDQIVICNLCLRAMKIVAERLKLMITVAALVFARMIFCFIIRFNIVVNIIIMSVIYDSIIYFVL